ncbi:MAG TPA: HAMP domain-containing histidine kinase [Clostridiales bacterium]|nr:HAMP domain-containing histidine kinase [Clostridiales bacterium]
MKIISKLKEKLRFYRARVNDSLALRIAASGIVSAALGFIIGIILVELFTGGYFSIFDPVSMLLVTIVTLFFFLNFLKKILTYIMEITHGVARISDGDFSVRIPERFTDELGRLAGQINKMAEQLKASREQERLQEQRKNEFITSIAHDLRTPLTSVIGYLGLISQQDGIAMDKEAMVKYADVAYRKALRLQDLITELFEFSRYNFEEITPAQEKIDLAELLEQLEQEFYPQFSENNLTSRIIVNDRPVYIKGDGMMIARVFDNILSNAVRYGAGGKYIDIEIIKRQDEAVVRITNYGSSISQRDLERIFDKFYRTDSSRNAKTGGAGLGLAIAKNIVKAHGGTIKAESRDNKTTFEVVFKTI